MFDDVSGLEVALIVINLLLGVVGYLLHRKDTKQERSIDLLFHKHDTDVAELNNLRVQIATNHYHKLELDNRFAQLNDTFKDVGTRLEVKFDKLQELLIKHMAQHLDSVPKGD